jgi:RimJ/RimL family protein N-acetyltransferase
MKTTDLNLVPFEEKYFEAIANNDNVTLAKLLCVNTPLQAWTHFPEAMPFFFEFIRKNPDLKHWCSYFIIHSIDNQLIGTCGFKGAPTEGGVVEMGYEIRDDYQGRGLATQAALALVNHAFSQGVTQVWAHTLAEENASCQVLRKLGFERTETVEDPEDGTIWRWERT